MKNERHGDRSALEVRPAREISQYLGYKIGKVEPEMLHTDH